MSNYQVNTLKDKAYRKTQALFDITSLKPIELLPLPSDVNKEFLSCLKLILVFLVYYMLEMGQKCFPFII